MSGSTAQKAAEAGRWSLLIALAFLVVGVPLIAWATSWVWWQLAGRKHDAQRPSLAWGRSLVVGADNRASTSKTAALAWTYTLAGALLSFLVARWLGYSQAFDKLSAQGLNTQYAVLIGGPIGAAILAKGIVSAQVESGSSLKPESETTSPAQLVQGDNGQTDLGDVQYLLFNIVALAFFYGEILRAPAAGLPNIPEVLVGLTSVAAVGFVGKKTLAGPAAIGEVTPSAATVGSEVTIPTSGIVKSEADLPALSVSFGKIAADSRALKVMTTASLGVLIKATVPPDAAGKVDIDVSVPGQQLTRPAFQVIPQIVSPAQHLRGRVGDTVEIMTNGVVGLGEALPGLEVTIERDRAATALDAGGNLQVTVPASAQAGTRTITLSTPGGVAQAHFEVLP
jgi:hypothetical protein